MTIQQVKLGILVPATNSVAEPDMYKMAPKGVTVHSERLQAWNASRRQNADLAETIRIFEEAGDNAVHVAPILAQVGPAVIAFTDTSASFLNGIEYNENLAKKIEAAAGVRATTASTAVVEALRALALKKICLITPYLDYFTEKGKEFLEASGFEVPIYKGMGLGSFPMSKHPPEAIYELVINTFDKNCDGIFVSCTDFRAVDIIEKVEKYVGKPMVSSNQATMWLMLKLAGVKKRIGGFGELLTNL